MIIDPCILTLSALTVIATIWMGFWSAKRSRTAHDFFVAGRSVSVGWNASAISGEYLSAASFMGVAGMVMSSGYDALWYPVCYACGYLFLLLFIAGPLRRFGAYTIPDFAEGRFDSPVFRKIAVVFVLFIGFFYTMPQMKGAGTTLAYIFPGLPYWAGVVLVGAVITLNVALGGMKGITLVQAFQYWLKMFAIAVPIFALMAVYGNYGKQLENNGNKFQTTKEHTTTLRAAPTNSLAVVPRLLPDKAPPDQAWLSPFGPLTTKPAKAATAALKERWRFIGKIPLRPDLPAETHMTVNLAETNLNQTLAAYAELTGRTLLPRTNSFSERMDEFFGGRLSRWRLVNPAPPPNTGVAYHRDGRFSASEVKEHLEALFRTNGIVVMPEGANSFRALSREEAAAALQGAGIVVTNIPLKASATANADLIVRLQNAPPAQALGIYEKLTDRKLLPANAELLEKLDGSLKGQLRKMGLLKPLIIPGGPVTYQTPRPLTAAELKQDLEAVFATNGITLVAAGRGHFQAVATKQVDSIRQTLAKEHQASLARSERRYALLYTYSLIIALVCGTAGLPHILVRFYTNPDGAAAKRTTMWVMILIGVFYLFPPVFGVLGRNLLPELYAGAGAKGTDKIVLELPRILNESVSVSGAPVSVPAGRNGTADGASAATRESAGAPRTLPWGSLLSGVTCAGAFAAFMSTFSGLLVSMTGALAHDVYGRMLRPRSTPHQRMRAFRVCAVIIGAVAILLGMQVEPFQINFMVGQAFAIAAASYFPLLFVSCWWRGLTMKGAATGMLTGGLLALTGISLTSFSDLGWLKLAGFWADRPMVRVLCEQPAIWTVPLAIGLMVAVSRLTRREIPGDIRMKMLVLHAPERLGLKQEYIQEHQEHQPH